MLNERKEQIEKEKSLFESDSGDEYESENDGNVFPVLFPGLFPID